MDLIIESPKGGNVRKNSQNVVKENVDIRETLTKGGNVRKNVWQTKAEKLKAKDIYKIISAN